MFLKIGVAPLAVCIVKDQGYRIRAKDILEINVWSRDVFGFP